MPHAPRQHADLPSLRSQQGSIEVTRSKGGDLLAKPTAAIAEMPVNEPCFTYLGCRGYDQAKSEPTAGSGYVCCVKRGTCNAMLSDTAKYFEGGCQAYQDGTHPLGAHYYYSPKHIKKGVSNESMTNTWATGATTTPGCVKQGECVLPYTEQIMHWTGSGGEYEVAAVPDAVMDRLLFGAVEAYPDACRDIYPRTAVTATHHVKASITIEVGIPPPSSPPSPSIPSPPLLHLPLTHTPLPLYVLG